MCKFYCDCIICRYDKSKCFCMFDGKFCSKFRCLIPFLTGQSCGKECITHDEVIKVIDVMECYNG